MKKLTAKGFTLIELLVVITIIGILATGATAVYSSAQQKARDSIRQNDLLAVRSAIEQAFGDESEYPEATSTALTDGLTDTGYMPSFPSDPKSGQADTQTTFVYLYGVTNSSVNNVAGQEYELSANFENQGNADTKEDSDADGGEDDNRWEIGVGVGNVCTTWTTGNAADACTTANDYENDGTTENAFSIDTI